MAEIVPIPEPPGLPFLGNLPGFGLFGKQSISKYADEYGPIFRVRFAGQSVVVISSYELINEVCDERRFHKSLKTVLRKVREGVHDALFTAPEGSETWDRAHRILVPAFGSLSVRNMFDEMYDVSSQMALKFARHGPQASILTSDDFSKLTLDTIALCSMDYRFNSFYTDEMHPFIRSMIDFLKECESRHKRPAFLPDIAFRAQSEKFFEDIAVMKQVASEVVEARKKQPKKPSERKDLLTAMLSGKDPKTGEKLSDDNISDNLITFLIAGHETTSGMLCFAFYHILKNPEVYRKLQEEVDEVVGRERITVEHISKFRYIQAVLRESLRVTSTIPAFALEPFEDTLLAGKYALKKGEAINCLIHRSHVDPAVHGADAKEFKPERMLEENFNALNERFPNFWKPFGNGKRSCIGRAFGWQEAVLCVAMMFQNFDFEMDDDSYELKIARTLTVKPEEFRVRARLRHGMSATELERRLAGSAGAEEDKKGAKKGKANGAVSTGVKKPLAVYYGSDGGTCEAMAQRLAVDAPSQGFSASTVSPLDDAKGCLPTDRPVVIVTASYEGQPPSNAKEFVSWIEDDLRSTELEGVNYAVYGCGHRDWHSTFHRIPHLVDATLEKRGGARLVPFSGTDAHDRDMFSDFETWEDTCLWPALRAKYGIDSDFNNEAKGLSVEISTTRHEILKQDVQEAVVISESTLTAPGTPAKKHIELQLPSGMTYQTGDYLAVLPFNPPETVGRVFRRFQLAGDVIIRVSADVPTSLPVDRDISVRDALGGYVELSQPATKKNIAALMEVTADPETKIQLEMLAGECFTEQISSKHISILDLLERFPSISLSFSAYLSMLPPIRVRQYSISSSSKTNPSSLTLTYSLFSPSTPSSLPSPPPSPPLSSWSPTPHIGVATTFLSSLRTGDKLPVSIRKSTFRPPSTDTPLICIAAGSGIAPFRGFIQERVLAMQSAQGEDSVAPALLLFGCRHPQQDDIYASELATWETVGAVSTRRAYSRASEQNEGCKYVQDRLWLERHEVWKMWEAGAKVYVCGGREMGHAVENMFVKIAMNAMNVDGKGLDEVETKAWLERQRGQRFAMDLFD